jgi:hypothetical protein
VLEGLHQPDLLPVALGQHPEPPGRVQVQPPDQLLDPCPVQPATQPPEPGEQLPAGHRRVDLQVAGQVADPAAQPHLAGERAAQHLAAPGGGAQEAQQQPDGGGLAGAVGAEEADHLARVNLQGERVDGGDRAEAFGQLVGDDRRDGHGSSSSPVSAVNRPWR